MIPGQRVFVKLWGEGSFVDVNVFGNYRIKLDEPGAMRLQQDKMGGVCFKPSEVQKCPPSA